MDLGLKGKRAVVTGASKGIGLAVTRSLVEEGVMVVAGSRTTTAELDELTGGRGVVAVQVDLATPAGPLELVNAALQLGPLDIVVNNVGAVATRLDGFLAVTDEQWLNSLTLTFLAAV